MPTRSLRLIAISLACATTLVLGACTGDDDDGEALNASENPEVNTPRTVLNASGEPVDAATLNSTDSASVNADDPAVEPSGSTIASGPGGDALDERTKEIVPDRQVEAGIDKTKAILSEVQATLANGGTSRFEVTAMWNSWYSYEGTIEQNDPAAYKTMDDALSAAASAAEANDVDGVASASEAFAEAADAYLGA